MSDVLDADGPQQQQAPLKPKRAPTKRKSKSVEDSVSGQQQPESVPSEPKESIQPDPPLDSGRSKRSRHKHSDYDRDAALERLLSQFLEEPDEYDESGTNTPHESDGPSSPPPSSSVSSRPKRKMSQVQLDNLARGREKAVASRREKKKQERDREAQSIAQRAVEAALASVSVTQSRRSAAPKKKLAAPAPEVAPAEPQQAKKASRKRKERPQQEDVEISSYPVQRSNRTPSKPSTRSSRKQADTDEREAQPIATAYLPQYTPPLSSYQRPMHYEPHPHLLRPPF